MMRLEDALDLIEPMLTRDKFQLLLDHYAYQVLAFPASVKYHHKQRGGWKLHVEEVISFALNLNSILPRSERVSESDIVIAAIIHDLGKLISYEERLDETFTYRENFWKHLNPETWAILECGKFGIQLTAVQTNALLMAEGGWSGFARTPIRHGNPVAGPLAVLIHSADLISSHILGD